ncbi:hypothetical protein JMM81_06130 [Bacillus sp. V3B]|uniref:hypothetical protein n=1 Tax=Bacillus sp. V3B TaxID=2804915 RepID=UPI00210EFD56|nr:hypothetical protein [Bacillus sp. V3B]MCQ6274549.1 hypothetical protein [Bacillus sp. V3B]
MKRLLPIIILMISIILGLLFLAFVLRMTWFTPGSMGMMMGPHMMYNHMSFWFSQMFWILLIIIGIMILIWLVLSKKRKK